MRLVYCSAFISATFASANRQFISLVCRPFAIWSFVRKIHKSFKGDFRWCSIRCARHLISISFAIIFQIGDDRLDGLLIIGSFPSDLLRLWIVFTWHYWTVDDNHTESHTVDIQHSWWTRSRWKCIDEITKILRNSKNSIDARVFCIHFTVPRINGWTFDLLQWLRWVHRWNKYFKTRQDKCKRMWLNWFRFGFSDDSFLILGRIGPKWTWKSVCWAVTDEGNRQKSYRKCHLCLFIHDMDNSLSNKDLSG